jgi:hypothetical protein
MMSSVEPKAVTDAELYARHGAELARFASVLVGPSGSDDLVAGGRTDDARPWRARPRSIEGAAASSSSR